MTTALWIIGGIVFVIFCLFVYSMCRIASAIDKMDEDEAKHFDSHE